MESQTNSSAVVSAGAVEVAATKNTAQAVTPGDLKENAVTDSAHITVSEDIPKADAKDRGVNREAKTHLIVPSSRKII